MEGLEGWEGKDLTEKRSRRGGKRGCRLSRRWGGREEVKMMKREGRERRKER